MAHSDAASAQLRRDDANSGPAPPRVDIGEALDHGWFQIWYQPRIDLKRKCLAGAEAMVCVQLPDQGVLMPGEFTCEPATEIAQLSERALMAALKSWSLFDEAGFNLGLAINVPAQVLLGLPLQELLAQHRPASERWPGIIVQVNEDEIVREPERARAIAAKLRIAGIKLAIDDFGAGYSSLSSLRELPFAEIRIDHSFVCSCATDATHGAICQTAIDLAHRFGSAAAAAGIESQADLQALMIMGCDLGQGALISPPLAQNAFLDLLHERVTRPRPQSSPLEPKITSGIVNKVA